MYEEEWGESHEGSINFGGKGGTVMQKSSSISFWSGSGIVRILWLKDNLVFLLTFNFLLHEEPIVECWHLFLSCKVPFFGAHFIFIVMYTLFLICYYYQILLLMRMMQFYDPHLYFYVMLHLKFSYFSRMEQRGVFGEYFHTQNLSYYEMFGNVPGWNNLLL